MTPQERQLIDDLFDRLASLENSPREADAVRAIRDGLQRAPNALYPLVQTALVQDEALKRAHARIQELEDELGIEPGEPAKQPGFLDNMRDALLGTPHGSVPQGSVPSVRPGAPAGAPASPWRTTTVQQPAGYPGGCYGAEPPGYGAQPVGSGGSFLGTAAATVAGVVGGALLMNSFRGMFGGQHMGQSAFGSGQSGTPWGGDASGSDMARDAGLNDIGRGGGDSGNSQHAGLFDANSDDGGNDDNRGDFDVGGDFSGGDSSDT
jgi:hypothetical protein